MSGAVPLCGRSVRNDSQFALKSDESLGMVTTMLLSDQGTWPAPVVKYLDAHYDLFLNWEVGAPDRVSGSEFDRAIYGLRKLLSVDCALHGYHCTRLTDAEIQHILDHGMQLPDRAILRARIDAAKRSGLVGAEAAAYLKDGNEAHQQYRAGMLWFCFFPPHIAGQSGIERFFRSWGGEALYVSHERDPVSGPILSRIGVPCLVEAYVPIASLEEHGGLDFKVIRRYLVSRGLKTCEPVDHEDRAKQPIPSANIVRVIRFPDREFIRLTESDAWKPALV